MKQLISKKSTLAFAFLFISNFTYAQKGMSNKYDQKNFQINLRAGLANTSLATEIKLKPRLNLLADLGSSFFYFFSERGVYNKYNHQYAKYYDEGNRFINLGAAFWCGYGATSLRYLFNQNTRVKYEGLSKVNSFGYLAVELRANSAEIKGSSTDDPLNKFRETYRLGLSVGRQLAFSKNGIFFYDIAGGVGLVINYRFENVAPTPLLSIRVGANLFGL